MLQIDHLVIIAPTLEEGAAHVYDELGVEMSPGGKHPQMGTHNLLLRLGDEVFLEVIAIDPAARPPSRPRWFGLDDNDHVRREWDDGRRLRAWVAQTDEIGTVLRSHADLLGAATPVSRGERTWRFTLRHDGELPAGGIAPPVIDWSPKSNPARDMPDQGTTLRSFDLFTPEPERAEQTYARLRVRDAPVVHEGDRQLFTAQVDTPSGVRSLS